ncbi:MAG: methylaspartate ammonia-lyase [Candidatus Aminicenantes bacterium]|uniref:methylaspartate ammonia-lyase n=1 Tax=Candidatus Saccharicenans subterraneus TaxID=2508984 RepID=A0A3E2BKJ6_9BACT|nr:methylaspartate ammonia-lyase [Candidatus Aminicenantes bacterium]RFT15182.1 MAG: Methylaspartate ammonia-lyase [Candidatus Saccharicenans subterraneum]
MKIKRVLFVPGKSAFFFDDQKAIKKGARTNGFVYEGKPVTKGFQSIRMAGESLSIVLELEDGQLAVGDCAAVQYSGVGGRDPLFLAGHYLPFMEKNLRPLLEGMEIEPFRKMADRFEQLRFEGKRLHTAIRYGLSQALLDARARAEKKLKCEIVCEEYNLPIVPERVKIFGQSGDDRYTNADKMILKQVDALPHALINNVEDKLGRDGEKLREYIRWLADRIVKLRPREDYRPDLHIDVYGTIGLIFEGDLDRVADYIASLEKEADGFNLYIEGPVDLEEKYRQLEGLARITRKLEALGSRVKIVADEHCNTLEDIREFTDARACHMIQIKTPDLGGIQNVAESNLYCKTHGIEAYQGGTCNETDISAIACVHVAMATRPDRMLAKPGMGFDEGFMIVNNEMERIIQVLKMKHGERRP